MSQLPNWEELGPAKSWLASSLSFDLHVKAPKRNHLHLRHQHPLRNTPISRSCTLDTMVYYHTSNVVTPSAFVYVGKDKVESMRSPSCTADDRLTLAEMRI